MKKSTIEVASICFTLLVITCTAALIVMLTVKAFITLFG